MNLKKLFVFFGLFFSFGILFAQDLPTCAALEGKWTGVKNGPPFNGPITIIFTGNCNYEWFGATGSLTKGVLTKKRNVFWYRNRLGSRGKVSFIEDQLIWVNTWTGNNYEVIIRKDLPNVD